MEQTIGKRIMENRKRLGLTQDALAEKLGVTAQAVSKWENDQSCPDITTLPKLAEIFGISTDALLGYEQQTVHEAEVVEDTQEHEPEGLHVQKGSWEFKWDSGKKSSIFFAVFVLLTGCLTILSRLLELDASFWDILWPCALLSIGIHRLFGKFSCFGSGCTLLGIYFLVANMGFWKLKLNLSQELVFPIIVVLFGISLLVDALRKPKKPKFTVSRNGVKLHEENGRKKTESHFSTQEDTFDCSLCFGERTHEIPLSRLHYGDINCTFGEMTVDLRGCEALSEDCRIDATCTFGQLNLLVPKRFRVHPDSHTAFASVSVKGQPDPAPQGVLQLNASVNFGEIEIIYM